MPATKTVASDSVIAITGEHLETARMGWSLATSSPPSPTNELRSSLDLTGVDATDDVTVVAETRCGTTSRSYRVVDAFLPAATMPTSDAVALDDPRIAGWASEVESFDVGTDVVWPWSDPEQALGPAEGTSVDVTALGRGGALTLRFDPPLSDGPGPDFAVFENGFMATYLELAFVEVSSDGVRFARFDGSYLGLEPVDPYGLHDPELIDGLAGKYEQGFGTPFDLAVLDDATDLDVTNVRFVRIIDIVGDGSTLDGFGRPIYDPYPTVETAGFDLDGIARLGPAL